MADIVCIIFAGGPRLYARGTPATVRRAIKRGSIRTFTDKRYARNEINYPDSGEPTLIASYVYIRKDH